MLSWLLIPSLVLLFPLFLSLSPIPITPPLPGVFCWLCSGLFHVPLAVCSFISTLNSFSSTILRSGHIPIFIYIKPNELLNEIKCIFRHRLGLIPTENNQEISADQKQLGWVYRHQNCGNKHWTLAWVLRLCCEFSFACSIWEAGLHV